MLVYGSQDAFFSPAARSFSKSIYSADRVRWFQSVAAGLENPFLQKVGRKAEIYTSCHVQAEAIAEWVLWAAFDFFGCGQERRDAQASRAWPRIEFREVGSTRWLIYGFGHIGEAVGRRLRGLGAHVTGVRRSSAVSPFADRIIHPKDVSGDDLGSVDAVLLCCPHTPETESMANADFFAAMRADSLFLNVGRGALVDEGALLGALESGKPAHATLDVTREEPLPKESQLWAHRCITLTPHSSTLTDGTIRRNDEQFLDNLGRFLSNEPMLDIVDATAFQEQSVKTD